MREGGNSNLASHPNFGCMQHMKEDKSVNNEES